MIRNLVAIIGLVLSLFLGTSLADYQSAKTAFKAGDYAGAFTACESFAKSGEARCPTHLIT